MGPRIKVSSERLLVILDAQLEPKCQDYKSRALIDRAKWTGTYNLLRCFFLSTTTRLFVVAETVSARLK